ncbi:TonB-dependent receptor [Actinobacillus seminis]|uniref:Iron-regulated outer membrane protein n=1 Tax=Actinobacillus seminis TaxID=722 RepID=A0A263HAL0_9PAST|nr:TonB-dependent receptor [Actinobacillus seminis]OZN24503.1 TonB-dependent receptor [Actinobacillus seminis]SUU38503.1 iron-regulated outer membrane protein [Actinobacillus seminis]
MKLSSIPVFLTGLFSVTLVLAHQDHEQVDVFQLDEIKVESTPFTFSSDPLSGAPKFNDIVVNKQKLKARSSTLGNALNGELGVHSSQFGGGASAPVIRGQEGVRLKVLQNGSDVVDMSQISPDHAIGVDTLLSQQVEIVRGASTLLYANASPAGVVNVIDNRIPTSIPEKGYDVDLNWRYNNNSNEKLGTAGITGSVGKNIALRFEGLVRRSDNYHVPSFNLSKVLDYVPDTYNRTKSGNYGVSFIGKNGYIGASYNERRESYGIPGHNHEWDGCAGHVYGLPLRTDKNYYLLLYKHLISDKDLDNPHFHCGSSHAHDGHNHDHSPDHPYGHDHDPSLGGPTVNSQSKRYDVKAELNQVVKGLDKIKLSYSTTDYKHDESDGHVPVNLFKNDGYNFRTEFFHTPIANLTGVWGVQYQSQIMSANIPRLPPKRRKYCPYGEVCPKEKPFDSTKITEGDRVGGWALIENKNTQLSFFAVEQLRYKDFLFELGARTEEQKIKIDYDVEALKKIRIGDLPLPDLSGYHDRANSYALSISWNVSSEYMLNLSYSHNERHPTPMELYYHGNHIATNSFEYGNKDLKKEVSDNFEMGISYEGDKLSYKASLYYNDFDNHIFSQTLNREGNLSLNRYTQSKAKYYGVEGQIDYSVTPEFSVGIFGDYIRGKLSNLPDFYHSKGAFGGGIAESQPNQNAPRVPPARLGLRTNIQFTDNILASVEYIHVFKQDKVTAPRKKQNTDGSIITDKNGNFEWIITEYPTDGYNMVNMNLEYNKTVNNIDYQIFIQGNNLLNEKVYSHASFLPFVPQMGRNITVGMNIHF